MIVRPNARAGARFARAVVAVCQGIALLLVVAGCAHQPGSPPVIDRTSHAGAAPAADAASAPPALPAAQPLHGGLPPDGHVVQPGDTLYGIAWRYGLDYRTVAQLNGIEPPYRIVVGQRLQLAAPPAGPAGPAQPGLAGGPIAAAPGPAMVPAEPSSRGFEFVPDSPAAQQDVWQDMPPPVQTAPGVGLGGPGPAPVPPVPGTAPGAYPTAPGMPFPDSQAPAGGPPSPAVAAGPVAALPTPAPVVPESQPVYTPAPAPPPSTTASTTPGSTGGGWRWPTSGSVQKGFGNGNKGIDFRLDAAEPVVAAGGGEVVYAGNGLGGFRHLVILKHDQRYLSAYSLNRPIVVEEGQRLEAGAPIAGADTGSAAAGTLRFEIRRDGQPVDPVGVIGRR